MSITPKTPSLLFTPFELAGRPLRNRIVHASMTSLTVRNGNVAPEQIAYFANRARGGAAMVITEPFSMSPLQAVPTKTHAFDPANAEGLTRMVMEVEGQDCRLLAQIQDPGRARHHAGRHLNAVAPSVLPDDMSWSVPRALTGSEIKNTSLISRKVLRACRHMGLAVLSFPVAMDIYSISFYRRSPTSAMMPMAVVGRIDVDSLLRSSPPSARSVGLISLSVLSSQVTTASPEVSVRRRPRRSLRS